MKKFAVFQAYYTYHLVKHVIFLFNSELMHDVFSEVGEWIGKIKPLTSLLSLIIQVQDKSLTQKIEGIKFDNPVGLAAGYDYNGKLPDTLSSLGFGYGTIGTVTNEEYGGNPKPRLARLVKSKSLMVNKGFKNKGIKYILNKLRDRKFDIPIGLSIGATNKNYDSSNDAIKDVLAAFKKARDETNAFSYYELNISCPNIKRGTDFYEPKTLNTLLQEIAKLKLNKPIFIKMPIEKTDKEILSLLDVISKNHITGVIFGNTITDRKNKYLDPDEVKKWKVGAFSGRPTFQRSNELIKLTYKNYKANLIIIGCGGIFNGMDAYTKIKNGASLVQLVTALVFEGPFVPAKINLELATLLEKDGYKNVRDAIGKAA